MSLVNKSADWTPNYYKILIFPLTKSLKSLRAARIDGLAHSNELAKSLRAARIDELADSNEPAIIIIIIIIIIHIEEKMSKYTDLQIECQRMWNKKVEVIPVIIGATRIVDRNIMSYIRKIPGSHNIYNLQRSAILGTAHILREVLSIKPE